MNSVNTYYLVIGAEKPSECIVSNWQSNTKRRFSRKVQIGDY